MKLLSIFINALLTITTAEYGPDGHNDEMNLERRWGVNHSESGEKLVHISPNSQYRNFFLEMVYTLT